MNYKQAVLHVVAYHRFPCCGKVYPCDVCHDSTEDHPMERANRMICGFCSKEQVSSTEYCNTNTKSTSHYI